MTERYRFFGGTVSDPRQYNQMEFAQVFKRFFRNGLFPGVDQELEVTGTDPLRMAVVVSAGEAWVEGYWYRNEETLELDLPAADAGLPAIHRIVLRLDTVDERKISAVVKPGEPAVEPVAPELERTEQFHELALAQVYVAAGVTSVSDVDMLDERLDDTLCGRAVPWDVKPHAGRHAAGGADEITPAMIGAETPSGAQAKADAAEAAAGAYTDQQVGAIQLTADNVSLADTAGHFTSDDVEGALAELFQRVSDGKVSVAAAITAMGQVANGSMTFAQLAAAIEDISSDATAGAAQILAGYDAYTGGSKTTGTMPNRGNLGTVTLTTNGQTHNLQAGYVSGGSVVAAITNLSAGNVKAGVTVGGVAGTFTSDATAVDADVLSGKVYYRNGVRAIGGLANYSGADRQADAQTNVGTAIYLGIPDTGLYADSRYIYWNEPNWTEANIPEGLSMFGKTGTLAYFKKTAKPSNAPFNTLAYLIGADTNYTYHIRDIGGAAEGQNIRRYNYAGTLISSQNLAGDYGPATQYGRVVGYCSDRILYRIDTGNNVINVYNQSLTLIRSIDMQAATGVNGSSFNDVTVSMNDDFYIGACSNSGDTVYSVNIAGTFLYSCKPGGNFPEGVFRRPDGSMIALGQSNAGFMEFAPGSYTAIDTTVSWNTRALACGLSQVV